ncbi:MAG: zinc finger-like domain-containing protein, partial [Victivallales bacterium]
TCPACNGTGKISIACTYCGGYGKMICPKTEKCEMCKGVGFTKSMCPDCEGRGKVTCPDCRGKGFSGQAQKFPGENEKPPVPTGTPLPGGAGKSQKMAPYEDAVEILKIQEKWGIKPGGLLVISEPFTIVDGVKIDGEEYDFDRFRDMKKLSELFSKISSWDDEVQVTPHDAEYQAVEKLIDKVTTFKIIRIRFLESNRAIVETEDREKKRSDSEQGKSYYLIKRDNFWKIIHMTLWRSSIDHIVPAEESSRPSRSSPIPKVPATLK